MDQITFDMRAPQSNLAIDSQARPQSGADNILVAAWRRRGVVVICLVLSAMAATVALLLIPPRYRSETMLQLNLSEREIGRLDGGGPSIPLDANALIQGELKIIRSRAIASRVVASLHLDEPTAASSHGIAQTVLAWPLSALSAARDAIGRYIGAAAVDKPAGTADAQGAAEAATARRTAAEDRVMAGLTAETDNRSYILTIGYSADNPDRAAAITTAVGQEYIRRRMQINYDVSGKTVELLDREIAETNQALNQAEDTVQDYRAQTGLLELGSTENLNQQKLRALSSQLTEASLAREEADSRLQRVADLVQRGNVPSTADLQGSPLVQSLLERQATARATLSTLSRFGPRHPVQLEAQSAVDALDAALAAELRSAVAVLRNDAAARQQTEDSLRVQVDRLQADMIGSKKQESELRSRQLTAQSIRDRLAALTRNRDQAMAVQDLHPVAASLVVPAEPSSSPVSPRPIVIFPVMLAGGLAVGLILATFLEGRDQGLRSGADVEFLTGARCLGMLPDMPPHRQTLRPAHWDKNSVDALQFAEAVRAVGASVKLYDADTTGRVVLIASSEVGEGKSTLCLALAQSLVAAGKRVLLVDGTPHRPEGRPSIAQNAVAVAEPVDKPRQALTILQRRSQRWLASDVFSGGNFGHMLEQARRHFDVIVLEGAPVLLVADALVLGRMADTVIHVARWGKTKRHVVNAGLHQLREASVPVNGVVLTRVDLKRHAVLKLVDQCTYFLTERRFYEKFNPTEQLAHPNRLSKV